MAPKRAGLRAGVIAPGEESAAGNAVIHPALRREKSPQSSIFTLVEL